MSPTEWRIKLLASLSATGLMFLIMGAYLFIIGLQAAVYPAVLLTFLAWSLGVLYYSWLLMNPFGREFSFEKNEVVAAKIMALRCSGKVMIGFGFYFALIAIFTAVYSHFQLCLLVTSMCASLLFAGYFLDLNADDLTASKLARFAVNIAKKPFHAIKHLRPFLIQTLSLNDYISRAERRDEWFAPTIYFVIFFGFTTCLAIIISTPLIKMASPIIAFSFQIIKGNMIIPGSIIVGISVACGWVSFLVSILIFSYSSRMRARVGLAILLFLLILVAMVGLHFASIPSIFSAWFFALCKVFVGDE